MNIITRILLLLGLGYLLLFDIEFKCGTVYYDLTDLKGNRKECTIRIPIGPMEVENGN